MDLEDEFDPEEHDRQMAALYDDGYYDGKYFGPSKYFAPWIYFRWQRCMTMATMTVSILPRVNILARVSILPRGHISHGSAV